VGRRDLKATIGTLASFSQQDNLTDREAEEKLLEIVGRLESAIPLGRMP
jgi:hypothetical protein